MVTKVTDKLVVRATKSPISHTCVCAEWRHGERFHSKLAIQSERNSRREIYAANKNISSIPGSCTSMPEPPTLPLDSHLQKIELSSEKPKQTECNGSVINFICWERFMQNLCLLERGNDSVSHFVSYPGVSLLFSSVRLAVMRESQVSSTFRLFCKVQAMQRSSRCRQNCFRSCSSNCCITKTRRITVNPNHRGAGILSVILMRSKS